MNKRWLETLGVLLLCWGANVPTLQAQPEEVVDELLDQDRGLLGGVFDVTPLQQFDLPFSRLLGSEQPARLRGVSDQLMVSLPLSAMWDLESVEMHVEGIASQMLNEHSQLVISVNDHVVRQLRLNQGEEQRRFVLEIDVPVDILAPGFNRVELLAVQHYTDICEYPNAPQLWTDIDLAKSGFEVNARRRDAAPSLQLLDSLFDRTTWYREPRVPVFSPLEQDESLLAALGKVAQGIGQRFDYVPVQIGSQGLPATLRELEERMPESANTAVLVGTREQLSSLLGDSEMLRAPMPVIAVQRLPSNRNRFLVVITGQTYEQVDRASSVFAIPNVPWPDRTWAAVSSLDIPNPENLEQRFSIPTAGEGAFPIRALGFETRTFSGMNADSVFLPLWNNTWQGRAQVRVHLSYGSGLDNSSALAVLVNGVMQGQIPMNNAAGGSYEDYAVTIPAGAMNTGWNQLELRPLLIPDEAGGNCQTVFGENLSMTLYDDTTVQKFGGSELLSTDLAKISGRGSLYGDKPFGQDIGFHLTHLSPQTLSAGMTLVSKLSQIYDRPLLNSWFGVGENEDSSFHYWIGPYHLLPSSIRDNMSSSIPEWVEFEIPMVRSARIQVAGEEPWYFRLLAYFNLRNSPPAETTSITLSLQEVFSRQNFAISTRNSESEEVIAFTAPDETSLREGVYHLIDFGQWAQLRGKMAFWEPDGGDLYALTVEDAPFSAYGLRGGLGLWVSQNPWLSLWLLVLIILLMIRASQALLNRRNIHRAELEEGAA